MEVPYGPWHLLAQRAATVANNCNLIEIVRPASCLHVLEASIDGEQVKPGHIGQLCVLFSITSFPPTHKMSFGGSFLAFRFLPGHGGEVLNKGSRESRKAFLAQFDSFPNDVKQEAPRFLVLRRFQAGEIFYSDCQEVLALDKVDHLPRYVDTEAHGDYLRESSEEKAPEELWRGRAPVVRSLSLLPLRFSAP